jgi:ubiquinone/menaquinone biosynthesis C-methylase UbiE
MQDATRERFGRTADRIAALQDARAEELEAKVVQFVAPGGDERALDSGSGAGALAFALAPHVREVVAVDLVPELLEQGRKRGERFPNVTFVEGDATKLSFEPFSFDLAGSLRTLHHIARPELAVAQLARVTRPGGRVLVVDQIASVDPVAAAELNAFERARDPSHARALADIDLRHLFESNELVLLRNEYELEPRDLGPYLDLAGCEGEARDRAKSLVPPNYTAELGWYLLEKR